MFKIKRLTTPKTVTRTEIQKNKNNKGVRGASKLHLIWKYIEQKNEALKISQVVDINGDINKEISANERQEGNGATTAHTIQHRPSISTLLK